MTAPTSAVIEGVVTDSAGHPVADAVVAIAAAPGPTPDIAALTGPDGRFAIAAPLTGWYTISATAPGSGTGTGTVHVGAAGSLRADIEIGGSDGP